MYSKLVFSSNVAFAIPHLHVAISVTGGKGLGHVSVSVALNSVCDTRSISYVQLWHCAHEPHMNRESFIWLFRFTFKSWLEGGGSHEVPAVAWSETFGAHEKTQKHYASEEGYTEPHQPKVHVEPRQCELCCAQFAFREKCLGSAAGTLRTRIAVIIFNVAVSFQIHLKTRNKHPIRGKGDLTGQISRCSV